MGRDLVGGDAVLLHRLFKDVFQLNVLGRLLQRDSVAVALHAQQLLGHRRDQRDVHLVVNGQHAALRLIEHGAHCARAAILPGNGFLNAARRFIDFQRTGSIVGLERHALVKTAFRERKHDAAYAFNQLFAGRDNRLHHQNTACNQQNSQKDRPAADIAQNRPDRRRFVPYAHHAAVLKPACREHGLSVAIHSVCEADSLFRGKRFADFFIFKYVCRS